MQKRIDSLNQDSFWKGCAESRTNNSQKLTDRAGLSSSESGSNLYQQLIKISRFVNKHCQRSSSKASVFPHQEVKGKSHKKMTSSPATKPLPPFGSPLAEVNLSHRPQSEEDGSPDKDKGGGENHHGPAARNMEAKVRNLDGTPKEGLRLLLRHNF